MNFPWFSVLIATAVPNLSPVISLVGAIGFATLGVTIPAVLETVLYWDDGLGAYNWRLWKNIILFIASIFAMVTGCITSIIEIINEYKLWFMISFIKTIVFKNDEGYESLCDKQRT